MIETTTDLAPRGPGVIVLRPATASDDAFLGDLYASTRSDLDVVPWDCEQRAAFCEFQRRAQRESYRVSHPDARDDIVELDGVAVGRQLLDASSGAVVVVDIAIVVEARGRGIGGWLLSQVQAAARDGHRPVVLRVEHTNPARRLYERLGFVAVADHGIHTEMVWRP